MVRLAQGSLSPSFAPHRDLDGALDEIAVLRQILGPSAQEHVTSARLEAVQARRDSDKTRLLQANEELRKDRTRLEQDKYVLWDTSRLPCLSSKASCRDNLQQRVLQLRLQGHDDDVDVDGSPMADLEAMAVQLRDAKAVAAAANEECRQAQNELLTSRRDQDSAQRALRNIEADNRRCQQETNQLRVALTQVSQSLTETQLQLQTDGKLREVSVRCPSVERLLAFYRNPASSLGAATISDDDEPSPSQHSQPSPAQGAVVQEAIASLQADLMRVRGANMELKAAHRHAQDNERQALRAEAQLKHALSLAVRTSSCIGYFVWH